MNTASGKAMLLDQPAHVLLLPRGSADGERGRPERLRRADLGPVLHLPGLQRQGRLDAHVEQRRQHRRVPRNGDEEGRRQLHLQSRHRREAARREEDRGAVQIGERHGRTRVHHLSDPSRSDRAAGRRQVGQRAVDGRAAEGPHPVLFAHQGAHARRVQEGDGHPHQLVEQHALCERQRRHRLLPFELRPEARRQVRLDQAR